MQCLVYNIPEVEYKKIKAQRLKGEKWKYTTCVILLDGRLQKVKATSKQRVIADTQTQERKLNHKNTQFKRWQKRKKETRSR